MKGVYQEVLLLVAVLGVSALCAWMGNWAIAFVILFAFICLYSMWHFKVRSAFVTVITQTSEQDDALFAFGAWSEVWASLNLSIKKERVARLKLNQQLSRFTRAGEAIPDGIVIIDENNVITWANGVSSKHFGLNPIHDIGKPINVFIRDATFADYLQREEYKTTLILRTSEPDEQVLSVQCVPFEEHYRLVFSRDITTLEYVQTIHRDFVANVSHELRTPLTVVGGFLETMSDMEEGREAAVTQFLPLMLEQSHRMKNLVEDLLLLSNLENSPNLLTKEWVNMRDMMKTLKVEAEGLSRGRHTIKIQSDTDCFLQGSAHELRSALSNLVSNAIRYTPDGGTITLGLHLKGGFAEFSVTDTGIGIPKEHIPRLTERFYRVDRARSRENGGTGLGLAIVKHVLVRHSAKMEIRSEPGLGSVFTIIFPLN